MVPCVLHIVSFTLTLQWANSMSTADLKLTLLNSYESTIATLEEYLGMEKERLRIIKIYKDIFQNEQNVIDGSPKYYENPIYTFSFAKRLLLEYKFAESVINDGTDFAGIQSVLQAIKQLNIKKLAKHVLNGSFSFPITVRDCYEIGRILYETQKSQNALNWLFATLQKYETEEDIINSSNKSDIIQFIIQNASHLVDDIKDEKHLPKMLLSMKGNIHFKSVERHIEVKYDKITRFEALCRGEVEVPAERLKRLRCYYSNGPSPFFRIAPIKTEQLFDDPEVLMYYEVIHDNEISAIKELTKLEMHRSKVNLLEGAFVSPHWISKVMCYNDKDVPAVARVSRRLSELTSLNVSAAEMLQVCNYGIGGHFTPHYDAHSRHELNWTNVLASGGEGIATILLYLSDVEQGGATVFIHSGLTVYPVKNAGIYWRNLMRSGELDPRTLHGGCPVLLGSKISANKWFRGVGQELVDPCPLKKEPDFTVDTVASYQIMIPRTLVYIVSFSLSLQWVDSISTTIDLKFMLFNSYVATIDALEKYLFMEKERLRIIKNYKDMFQNQQNRIESLPKYIENPINEFSIVKRLLLDYTYTNSVINIGTDFDGVQSELETILQMIIEKLAKVIQEDDFSFSISVTDCFQIGQILFETQNPEEAVRWMFKSFKKYETKADKNIVKKSELLGFMYDTSHVILDIKDELIWPEILLPFKEIQMNESQRHIEEKHDQKSRFDAICRGEVELHPDQLKRLRCYYSNGRSPFFRIAPVKTEQLFDDPEVLLYYDVIYDQEISVIKEIASLGMRRAEVDAINGSYESWGRMSQLMWFNDIDVPAVARVSRRLSELIGFNVSATELLQVSNYGIGGYYIPHYDDYWSTDETEINVKIEELRLATILLYVSYTRNCLIPIQLELGIRADGHAELSDVELGGATAFLHSGLTVFPVKNAGLYWNNRLATGEIGPRTLHGACPVLFGSKLAANKWIKAEGQELFYTCPLKEEPDFSVDSYVALTE